MKRLKISAICLILSLLLAAGAAFAWFAGGSASVENLVINTARIDIDTELFRVRDFNADGILDVDESGNYLLEQDDSGADIDYTGGQVALGGFFPGRTETFLLRVYNLSRESCTLNVSLRVDTSNPACEVYSVGYADSEGRGFRKRLTDAEVPLSGGTSFVLSGKHSGEPAPYADFLFCIRMDTLETLRGEDEKFIAIENLNDYLNKTCALTLIAELEQVI